MKAELNSMRAELNSMKAELMKALYEQYMSYVEELKQTTKNLMTFLDQNKDFRASLDVSILLYFKSVDIKLSVKRGELCRTPDLLMLGGSRESLVEMCSELEKRIAE